MTTTEHNWTRHWTTWQHTSYLPWVAPIMTKTQDPVNQPGYDKQTEIGPTRLGVLTNFDWHSDPRRLLFRLARYKFVAKMLSGRQKVLELGCGDAFAAPIILQEVDDLTVSD